MTREELKQHIAMEITGYRVGASDLYTIEDDAEFAENILEFIELNVVAVSFDDEGGYCGAV